MGEAILVAALTGVLLVGARTSGTYAGKGIVKAAHAIHQHFVKPAIKTTKTVIQHETK